MADELKSLRIKVHQTLHGYSEGHRLIEGSVKLPQSVARVMLLLSDASASGTRIPAKGYLTGYPLSDVGMYVLARTWAAPEMSRPGCVWTHSLLIDFADLARLATAMDLLEAFVRPSGGMASTFGLPIELAISQSPFAVSGSSLTRARQLVGALYGKPGSRIVAERGGDDDEELIAAIWMQQWPRLRRTLRFCSFAVDDRSTATDAFDLQLVGGSRISRARMPDGVSAASVEGGDWLGPLLDDLEHPLQSGLRRFLRDVGADLSDGRAAMAPLTNLFAALGSNECPERVADAILDVERLGPGQGRMALASAAIIVFSRPNLTDERLSRFALNQVRSDRNLLGVDPALVGKAVLRWMPNLLGESMRDGDPLRDAVVAALPNATVDELLEAIATTPEAIPVILEVRPDLLEKWELWQIQSIDVENLLLSHKVNHDRAVPIITALITAGRGDYASAVVDQFGVHVFVRALAGYAESERLVPWLRALASRTSELARSMADGSLQDRSLLIALTKFLDPDAVPNNIGDDPWVIAMQYSKTSGDLAGEDALASFLFCRAMGSRSKSPGRLLFLSVQRLHEALALRRLSDVAWQMTERRLPWVSRWRDWDQCERLRRAVATRFIDHDLPPLEFGTVVDDDKLWSKLVDLAVETWRGRHYLDLVRSALRDGSNERWLARACLIDHRV
ncbi:hypothetical protein [Burkholderia gladioli]|uniref:GAP1-N1 domain-containing protein n=1 Tax=Burkholderia gladioli TaxID=28095 RepID=UPI0016410BA8|nr:hypothetical protein [Burkholderia gladioli]MDN7742282.1 hypothetical protein [Burkholderia gladioli]